MDNQPKPEEDYNNLYKQMVRQDNSPLLTRESVSDQAPLAVGFLLGGTGRFFVGFLIKISQLIGFVLILVILLLILRLTLNFFGPTFIAQSLSSPTNAASFITLFMAFSAPFVFPFNLFLHPIPYGMYSIDIATLFAMVLYIVLLFASYQFLMVMNTNE